MAIPRQASPRGGARTHGRQTSLVANPEVERKRSGSEPQVLPDSPAALGCRLPLSALALRSSQIQGRPGVTAAPGAPGAGAASLPARLRVGSAAGTSALAVAGRSARPPLPPG